MLSFEVHSSVLHETQGNLPSSSASINFRSKLTAISFSISFHLTMDRLSTHDLIQINIELNGPSALQWSKVTMAKWFTTSALVVKCNHDSCVTPLLTDYLVKTSISLPGQGNLL